MKDEYTANQIDGYCLLIDEVVKKAEWVIIKALEHRTENIFELAALLSIKQMADYADAVAILIKNQSSDTTIPLIRSIFELGAGLEYMLQEDFDNRARKMLYFYYKKKEIGLLKSKEGTPENERFIQEIKKDKYINEDIINEIHSDPDIDEKLSSVQKTIRGKVYADLEKHYNSENENKKRHWYSLQGGPTSFKKLVESLGMHSRYHISYDTWSGHSHGWDIINKNLLFEGELTKIIAKRNPVDSDQNALETIILLRRSLMKYVISRLKEEIGPFNTWMISYKQKIDKEFYQK